MTQCDQRSSAKKCLSVIPPTGQARRGEGRDGEREREGRREGGRARQRGRGRGRGTVSPMKVGPKSETYRQHDSSANEGRREGGRARQRGRGRGRGKIEDKYPYSLLRLSSAFSDRCSTSWYERPNDAMPQSTSLVERRGRSEKAKESRRRLVESRSWLYGYF